MSYYNIYCALLEAPAQGSYTSIDLDLMEYTTIYLDNQFLSDTIARIEDVEELEKYHDETLTELALKVEERIENYSWNELDDKPFGENIEYPIDFDYFNDTVSFNAQGEGTLDLHNASSGLSPQKLYFIKIEHSNGNAFSGACSLSISEQSDTYERGEFVFENDLGIVMEYSCSYTAMTSIITIKNVNFLNQDFSVSFYATHEVIETKQLDEKYIPDTIARTSDIPTVEELVAAVIAALPAAEEVEI